MKTNMKWQHSCRWNSEFGSKVNHMSSSSGIRQAPETTPKGETMRGRLQGGCLQRSNQQSCHFYWLILGLGEIFMKKKKKTPSDNTPSLLALIFPFFYETDIKRQIWHFVFQQQIHFFNNCSKRWHGVTDAFIWCYDQYLCHLETVMEHRGSPYLD